MALKQPPHWTPEGLAAELRTLEPGELRVREPMSDHTTMRVGGPADVFVVPRDREALSRVVKHLRDRKIPWMAIGNGSNLLIRDGGVAGAVISLKALDRLEVLDVEAGRVFVEAGVHMTKLIRTGLEHGFEQVWFLSGIPGTLGGAVRMNAGTRYGEIQQVIESILVMTGAGNLQEIPRDALKFAYRTLELAKDRIVIGATLALGRGDAEALRAKHREVMAYRTGTQPLALPSVGSMFRNPEAGEKDREPPPAAGRLIEECGLKGVRVRGARISEKHANWIVNVGDAKTVDVLTLIRLIRDRVKQERGVTLELEAKVVGREEAEIPPLPAPGLASRAETT
jgi:UDP-N-acetylmuramate dehydrogenase